MATLTRTGAAQREAAWKLRSKFHGQHLSVASSSAAGNASAISFTTQQLVKLCKERRPGSFLQSQQTTRSLLESLPSYSIDEDIRFVHAQRILRSAMQYDLERLPIVSFAVQLHVKHSFLLDAAAAANFVTLMRSLRRDDVDDVLNQIAPRLVQLSNEFHSLECAKILEAMPRHRELSPGMTDVLLESCEDLSELQILSVVQKVSTALPTLAGMMLRKYKSRIVRQLVADKEFRTLEATCAAIVAVKGAPNDIVACVARCLLQGVSEQNLSVELCVMGFECLQHTGVKHERLMRRLGSWLCTKPRDLSPSSVLSVLRVMAHFHVDERHLCQEMMLLVVNQLSISTIPAALDLLRQLKCPVPELFGKPLSLVITSRQSLSLNQMAMVLYALVDSEVHQATHLEHSIELLLDEMMTRTLPEVVGELRIGTAQSLLKVANTYAGKSVGEKANIFHAMLMGP